MKYFINFYPLQISFDFEPILIEINSVPALFFSKTVVELITNKLLEDVIKVIIDFTGDPEAFTGEFELVYTHEIPKVKNYAELSIIGKKL